MTHTISEREFELFCQLRRVPLKRIPETDVRTPDYEITLGPVRIVVEVKETSPNPEERESQRLLELRGYGIATGGTPRCKEDVKNSRISIRSSS